MNCLNLIIWHRLKFFFSWPSIAKYGYYEMVYTNTWHTHYWSFNGSGDQDRLPCGWQKIHADLIEMMIECELIIPLNRKEVKI